MASRELLIKILGDPSDAVRALNRTGDAADATGNRLHRAGQLASAAFAVAGAAALAFAGASIKSFSDTAAAIDDLQDTTGETAESMSRLRYAFQSWGVSDEAMQKGLKALTKAVGANRAEFALHGIAIRDAAGQALPMSEVLANTADVFARMPDGIDKSNLALALFGKNGTELLDVLNEGRDGLAALGAQADKYGITIGQDAVDAQQRNAKAQREMHAAWQGIQIQLGQHLLPIIAKVTTWVGAHLPGAIATAKAVMERLAPVFRTVTDVAAALFGGLRTGIEWLAKHKELLIGFAAGVGAAMLALFIPWAVAAAAAAAATIAAALPFIALGAAVAAVVAAVVWMITHFETVKQVVLDAISVALTPLKIIFDTIRDTAVGAWNMISDVWGKVTGFFSNIWDGIKSGFAKVESWITAPFKAAFNAVAHLWNDTVGGFGFSVPDWVPFVGGNEFRIPKMPILHAGGIIPGLPGQDVLIMAQAGERITGTRQAPNGTTTGTGDRVQLVNHFYGITDTRALAAAQARELGWQLRVAA